MKEVEISCHICGKVLIRKEDVYRCSGCNTVHKLDEIFCKVCGQLMFDFQICPVCNIDRFSFCVHNKNFHCGLSPDKSCKGIIIKPFINDCVQNYYLSFDLSTYDCRKATPLTGNYIFTKQLKPINPKYYAQILIKLYKGIKMKVIICQINYNGISS